MDDELVTKRMSLQDMIDKFVDNEDNKNMMLCELKFISNMNNEYHINMENQLNQLREIVNSYRVVLNDLY